MTACDFDASFKALTDHDPFPWQRKLYERFDDDSEIPRVVSIPTGLGKTSVIAVWLIALARGKKVPRRLVYVVNRRTVVDQTTVEALRLRDNARRIGIDDLAISTLRGQFAENREWSTDPSRPAVICGTVDMIGSRLLFSGYGIGFKSRPLHAGFLGQDALLVHDEAHLEPAFQELISTIEHEQRFGERTGELPWPKLRVMQLTATTRGSSKTAEHETRNSDRPFVLTDEESNPPARLADPPTEPIHHLWRRLKAKKTLTFHVVDDSKDDLAKRIGELALRHKISNAAVLIFVRTLEEVNKVRDRLTDRKDGVSEDHVQQLTGTMRGLERDRMVDPRRPDASRVFARVLKPPKPDAPASEQWQTEPMPGTVYLVCTSAGEVGIDMSADHMVCDLSTLESMVQRLGRVNRFGEAEARIDVVCPASFGKRDKKTNELKISEIDKRRQKTLQLLRILPSLGENVYDASPKALGELQQRLDLLPRKIQDAFASEPTILPATDILFDAWALTSIRGKLPGRQPVEPYLHGVTEWEPPETYIAWRQEGEIIVSDLLEQHPPADLLDDYPLKPHELLRDRSDRVFKHLETLAERHADRPAWIVEDGGVVAITTLADLVDKRGKDRINDSTVLLPPSAGGLAGGMLDGASDQADDVADIPSSPTGSRIRIWSDDPAYESKIIDMRRVRSIEIDGSEDEEEPRRWEWFESIPLEGGRTGRMPVTLETHVCDVVSNAARIVAGLSLPGELADAIVLAARLHDHGKRRQRFQVTLGNRDYPGVLWAKCGKKGARLPEPFRHEFASVLDAQTDESFNRLNDEMKDLVLHLIAAHHGRARPHFPADEVLDPERTTAQAEAVAGEIPRRFARLQRRYGRWGLAYLESLLRAADWAASAAPSKELDGNGNEVAS